MEFVGNFYVFTFIILLVLDIKFEIFYRHMYKPILQLSNQENVKKNSQLIYEKRHLNVLYKCLCIPLHLQCLIKTIFLNCWNITGDWIFHFHTKNYCKFNSVLSAWLSNAVWYSLNKSIINIHVECFFVTLETKPLRTLAYTGKYTVLSKFYIRLF